MSNSHEEAAAAAAASNAGRNVFVGRISFRMSDDDLRAAFSRFGEIETCRVVRDPKEGTSRGFGFVTYTTAAAAEESVSQMNGTELEGRNIFVEVARTSGPHAATPGEYHGKRDTRRGYFRGGNFRGGNVRGGRGTGNFRGGRGGRGGHRDRPFDAAAQPSSAPGAAAPAQAE